MKKINKLKFFNSYRTNVGTIHSSKTVRNMDDLINVINKRELPILPQLAYMMATAGHETSTGGEYTFNYRQKEIRQRSTNTARRRKIKKWQDRYWHSGFYGRGFVMLTWRDNYIKATKALRKYGILVDLVSNPDAILTAEIGWLVLQDGMLNGWFTGKSLNNYINNDKIDFYNARRTVNGTFHAGRVKDLANKLLQVLQDSVEVIEEMELHADELPSRDGVRKTNGSLNDKKKLDKPRKTSIFIKILQLLWNLLKK